MAPSCSRPFGVPSRSRPMRPPRGSGVDAVMRAARNAALLATREWPPRSSMKAGLEPVRWTLLSQLARAVAHALLPFARLEAAAMRAQPRDDVRHIPGRPQVRPEPRESVVHDVRVRVVETGHHRPAPQRNNARARASPPHQLSAAC